MEHRRAKRISVSIKLLIYRKGVPVATGRMENISSTGLFVRSDYCDIDIHQQLEVEFQWQDSSGEGSCRAAAIVVHKNNGGLGLEFVAEEPQYQEIVRNLAKYPMKICA